MQNCTCVREGYRQATADAGPRSQIPTWSDADLPLSRAEVPGSICGSAAFFSYYLQRGPYSPWAPSPCCTLSAPAPCGAALYPVRLQAGGWARQRGLSVSSSPMPTAWCAAGAPDWRKDSAKGACETIQFVAMRGPFFWFRESGRNGPPRAGREPWWYYGWG